MGWFFLWCPENRIDFIDNFVSMNSMLERMKDWEQMQKDLDELELLRKKKFFMAELVEVVEEMKLIKEGKLRSRSADDFLNEL